MIKIIYEWNVSEQNFNQFKDAWTKATKNIHQTVDGAMGSFMIRSTDDPEKVLTVAKWKSLQAWKLFWEGRNPSQMLKMRELATRLSVESFEEIDDQTVCE